MRPDAFADAIVSTIKRSLEQPQARITALEQRLARLESKPHVKFCGVWTAGAQYAAGDAATHHGGLWIAKADTGGEPGKDFVGWQLAVKRGDAR